MKETNQTPIFWDPFILRIEQERFCAASLMVYSGSRVSRGRETVSLHTQYINVCISEYPHVGSLKGFLGIQACYVMGNGGQWLWEKGKTHQTWLHFKMKAPFFIYQDHQVLRGDVVVVNCCFQPFQTHSSHSIHTLIALSSDFLDRINNIWEHHSHLSLDRNRCCFDTWRGSCRSNLPMAKNRSP